MSEQAIDDDLHISARVEYEGDANQEAEIFYKLLATDTRLVVEAPEAIPSAEAPLGVATVFLALAAVKVGSAAARSVLTVAVNKIEAEFKRRHDQVDNKAKSDIAAAKDHSNPQAVAPETSEDHEKIQVQVSIRLPNNDLQSFPPLGPASIIGPYVWEVAFEAMRKLIDAL